MSGTVEDEVVRMRFDNNAFERGVSTTLGTLAKLKAALTFNGADKGLNDVEAKASKFDMSNMNKQIDDSAHHWSAWRTAGLIAFATVVHRAVNAGINIVKAFTVNPIAEGFKSYETQINAAKTIIANTGAKLPQVEAQLAQLQTYAQQTVYSFSDMAQNIGTFTAAGVKLVPAVSAIKGMGNSAALSGASVQQLNSAMYQMSQAMSSGVIKLQDWNSLSNANMGGKNIQNALMETARTIDGTGPKMDAAIKKYGNFRNSLTDGWLTADVFSKAMGVMAGHVDKATGKTVAFTVAQLKAKGYTQAAAEQLNKLSQAAIDSATQIRTYSQMTDALKEEVANAWGNIFKTIFGNVNGATKFFTALHNVLEALFTGPLVALNKYLIGIKKLGGIAIFIDAIKLAFKTLGSVIAPIKEAFREIFPAKSAAQVVEMIKHFHVFIENLQPMPATLDKIKRIFAGIFAVFDIGKQIVMGIAHMFMTLFGALSSGSGGFLSFVAKIGDMIVAFDQALKAGNFFTNFFQTIGNVLSVPLHLLGMLGTLIGGLFSGFHTKDGAGLTKTMSGVNGAMSKAATATGKLANVFSGLQAHIRPVIDWIVNAFHNIGSAISKGLGSQAFGNILSGLNTGLLAGIVLLLKKFFSNGLSVDIGNGFLGKAGEAIEGVTGSLKAMQTSLKAKALRDIAIAVGILALSIIGLSFVPAKKIQSSMAALAVGFGELLASMAILSKIGGSSVKLPILAASLNLIATAILILAGAVLIMSRLSWQEIEKGLTVIGALLLGLVAASYALSSNSLGLLAASVGITAISVAMNLLYLAVLGFSKMSWGELLKGLAGAGMALAGIAIAMRLMPKGMLFQAASLLLIASALGGLYLAIKGFSSLSWGDMVKGLIGIGGALTAIALAMKLMPRGMVLQAAALNLVATALQGIAKAVGSMGKMSWIEIAKGLTALAGSLVVLAGGLYLMTGTLGGAAALFVVAAGLKMLVPSLVALGKLSWGSILKGLLALAATFGAIGLAALLLSPVIPAMLGLGVALGVVGVAMLAFGAGAALLGVGLTAIAASGGAAIGVLITGLRGLLNLLPLVATSIATAFVNFVTIIGSHAPAIVGAFVSMLNQLLQAFPKILPNLVIAMNSLIQAILQVIITNAPRIIAAGFTLLMDFLKGISDNIVQVTTTVVDIVVKFLDTLANNMGRIVQAGVNLLFKFLEGVASAAGQVPGEAIKIVFIFLGALFSHFGQIVSAGGQMIGKLISGITGLLANVAQKGIDAVTRFIRGIAGSFPDVVSAGASIVWKLIEGLGSLLSDLGSKALELGGSIVSGILNGLGGLVSAMVDKLEGMLGSVIDDVGGWLGLGGPSKRFANEIGSHIPEGVALGIDKNTGVVVDSVRGMGKTSVVEMKKTMSGLSDAISGTSMNLNPTITPVLDLSQVQKDAGKINGLVAASPINPRLSYTQASDISSSRARAAAEAQKADASLPAPVAPVLNFEQNNYSPKAIGTVELYRQTNNQLSQAKKMLGVPAPSNG